MGERTVDGCANRENTQGGTSFVADSTLCPEKFLFRGGGGGGGGPQKLQRLQCSLVIP